MEQQRAPVLPVAHSVCDRLYGRERFRAVPDRALRRHIAARGPGVHSRALVRDDAIEGRCELCASEQDGAPEELCLARPLRRGNSLGLPLTLGLAFAVAAIYFLPNVWLGEK